jgi:hypothetical protein
VFLREHFGAVEAETQMKHESTPVKHEKGLTGQAKVMETTKLTQELFASFSCLRTLFLFSCVGFLASADFQSIT